jgi:hypothetical protein
MFVIKSGEYPTWSIGRSVHWLVNFSLKHIRNIFIIYLIYKEVCPKWNPVCIVHTTHNVVILFYKLTDRIWTFPLTLKEYFRLTGYGVTVISVRKLLSSCPLPKCWRSIYMYKTAILSLVFFMGMGLWRQRKVSPSARREGVKDSTEMGLFKHVMRIWGWLNWLRIMYIGKSWY